MPMLAMGQKNISCCLVLGFVVTFAGQALASEKQHIHKVAAVFPDSQWAFASSRDGLNFFK